MKKTHRNISIGVIIVIVVILIVAGILNGWFRTTKSFSKEVLNSIEKVKRDNSDTLNSDSAKKMFSILWYEHVKRTREYILSSLHNQPDMQEKEYSLLQNQKEIGSEIDKYFPGSNSIITDILTQHILIAKDIIEDLKHKQLLKVPSDINHWYDNADEFSDAMNKINSNWNLKSHMHEHLLITEYEVIYEWLGLHTASKNTYENKIVLQAQEIAKKIVMGLYPNSLVVEGVIFPDSKCQCYCSDKCGPRDMKYGIDKPFVDDQTGLCFCQERDRINYIPHACSPKTFSNSCCA